MHDGANLQADVFVIADDAFRLRAIQIAWIHEEFFMDLTARLQRLYESTHAGPASKFALSP